ncbi:DUF5320 domain-containing protein [Candidatus Bipolaricaulota bacterium]|nr:DUF5320 domain-containing protein [Candidatus Bipolaricaulota bacterium]
MPRGDRTGPSGQGPMTGRGAGLCSGYATPGFANPFGRQRRPWGGGWQRGMGYGWGVASSYRGFAPFPGYAVDPPTGKLQILALQSEAEHLRTMLAQIESQVRDLEQGDENSKE